MNKLTIFFFSVVATLSQAVCAAATTDVCNDGCEVIYLVVPVDGVEGQRVVRDTLGRCWQDAFVEEATGDPSITTMRPVSERVQVQCHKF